MIPLNKYTDETAHVANWLIYSGHVDLTDVIVDARQETEKVRELAMSRDHTWHEDIEHEQFMEDLAYCLKCAVEGAIPADYLSDIEDHGLYNDEAFYRDSPPECLYVPLIADAFRKIDFEQVAEFVLHHLGKAELIQGRDVLPLAV